MIRKLAWAVISVACGFIYRFYVAVHGLKGVGDVELSRRGAALVLVPSQRLDVVG